VEEVHSDGMVMPASKNHNRQYYMGTAQVTSRSPTGSVNVMTRRGSIETGRKDSSDRIQLLREEEDDIGVA